MQKNAYSINKKNEKHTLYVKYISYSTCQFPSLLLRFYKSKSRIMIEMSKSKIIQSFSNKKDTDTK